VESYVAQLSEEDHFNSNGDRLKSAAAIIRQDRANFHKFNLRDDSDEGDRFFASAENRALLEKMLEQGRSPKAAVNAIINGTPIILVEIFRRGKGEYYVTATLM